MRAPMQIRLATVSYPVRDLARARSFYGALLERSPVVAGSAEVRFMLDGVELQLCVDLRRDPPPKEGVLLTWSVPDLDRAVARAESAGGRCVRRRAAGEDGAPTAAATVTDPFGNYVALVEG